MQTFDLSTAASFLPIMDDTENVTKQLISSIIMYNSLLDENSKPVLLNFLLTTRLSDGAKLRLSKQYKTVEQLVDDMNKHLLTKKSFTSIQQQLLSCTQNQKTIDDYGKEIEDLFVELTVAQSDGDNKKLKVLQPLNEKTAINRFATGLRNPKLSTIIAARTYVTLKDAIRDAKDVEAAMPARGTNKFDNKQPSSPREPVVGPYIQRAPNLTGSGTTGRGGQGYQNQHGHGTPNHYGNSQASCVGYNQPSYHGHSKPSHSGHSHSNQPSHGGHSQPSRGGHNQLSRGGHNQPSRGGHSQPSRGGHSQPSRGGHSQPSRGGHSQPNRGGHNQPSRGGHNQPSRGGHGQPYRGNFQGGQHHAERNIDTSQVKVKTEVVVTTTTISNVKPSPKYNKAPNNSGPKNINQSKNDGPKNNTSKSDASKNNSLNKTNYPKNNPSKSVGPKK